MRKLIAALILAGICMLLVASGSEDLTMIGIFGLAGIAFLLLGIGAAYKVER